MTGLNYKKIIGVFLAIAIFALSLPLGNIHAQRTAPPEVEEGDDITFSGQTTTGADTAGAGTAATQPKDSVLKTLKTAACPETGGGPILNATACGMLTFGAWIVFVILMAVSAFFALFGNLFDIVTAVTLNPDTYSLPAIYNGWIIVRDTANLFFIFILLTIAIATILQIDTYGVKKLLPKLIIAALFINFSFLLTQYVIFSANLMTGFFLPGAGTERGPSSQLSVKFLAGINPNAMYKGTQFNLNAIAETQKKLQETRTKIRDLRPEEGDDISFAEPDPPDPALLQAEKDERQLQTNLESQQKELPNTLVQLIVAMLGVIAFIVVATGVLAFAGISLLIRVVVLWFLMILSPAAFLFYVVPGLSSHAKQWWDTLIKQAFFPVAFFFLFGLTVQMIATPQARGLFENAEKIAQQAGAGAINTALIVNFTAFAYYALLIIMLFASVIVAKQMGGVTAQWADKGYKAIRGYAWDRTKRYGGRAAGTIAERYGTEEAKGAIVRGLARVPLVGSMMGGALVRGIEKTKKAGGLEEIRKRQAETMRYLAPADRAAYTAGLTLPAKENLLNSMSEADVAQMLMTSPQNAGSLNAGIARLNRGKQENIRLEQFKRTTENERAQLFSGFSPEMQTSFIREKLSPRELVSLFSNAPANIRQAMQQTIGGALAQSPVERQEKFADEFIRGALRLSGNDLANSIDSLPDELRALALSTTKKEDVQKIAKAYDGRGAGHGDDFIRNMSQLQTQIQNAGNTQLAQTISRIIDDSLSVIPMSAGAVNRTVADTMPRVDFKAISQSMANNAVFMNTAVMRANTKQVKDIIGRGDAVTTEFRKELDSIFTRLNRNVDALVQELKTNNNNALADEIKLNLRFRQMVGLS